ncbi:hypothetical protein FC91_GL000675 [Schleiferilactobacillus harbinensis DSM 16991]|jgi:hypothetical protein|uniref:Uncharacterized protein n=2 Tax=Schleiferilactobacillus harbinensis TaxID=304207 RepID=A0A0R1X7M8_9LACO|nr:hypothetical protein FC91_GL000675 [Schleiferilactobacillus harbinensis DSM 16991]
MVTVMAKWTIDADSTHGVGYWLRYWILFGGLIALLLWWASWLWFGAWSVVTAVLVWAGTAVILAIATLLLSPFVITVGLVLSTVAILVLAIGSLIHVIF